ncbi:PA2169 family four-helix-bundle protein [Pararobbsia silviterrae]|uniref:PA2169 family four-helix-bundle protein n=1 Tax=Pararobbsia silviterrae TaxID=1792498 RepID=A0A494Y933_9BURK|nr:PA2169 family four-helix-bundle protein [Pararobbsia silviterrae]RKP59212.1 PA2169 family four-helix-bundle protein [Pararobbsia silviterrae]
MTNTVSVLNDLIETSKDGEQGFLKAAQDTTDPALRTLFTSRANACADAVRELQSLVIQLGGKPEDRGSVSGALHRGWVDVKSALSTRDNRAILADCEQGEDAAKKRYRAALDKDLPVEVRTLVEVQFQGVLQNHDRIRDLRDQYAAVR